MITPLYKVEFPDFELGVEIPEGWYEASWHNDICPSWEWGDLYKLFIDYKNPQDREMSELKRFCIAKIHDIDELNEAVLHTDNFEDVVTFTRNLNKEKAL